MRVGQDKILEKLETLPLVYLILKWWYKLDGAKLLKYCYMHHSVNNVDRSRCVGGIVA